MYNTYTACVSIFYYIILVMIEKVRFVGKSSVKVIFLGIHNRLSLRDSGDIRNNMGRFYHWRM